MPAKTMYLSVLGAISAAGAAVASLLGGWDQALETLVWMIGIDFILGILVALLWHKSNKSSDGSFDSHSSFKGLFRKGGILLVVLIAARLDSYMQTDGYIRTAVILFFIANEGFSIIENLGIMGVPLPDAIREAFSAIRTSGEKKNSSTE